MNLVKEINNIISVVKVDGQVQNEGDIINLVQSLLEFKQQAEEMRFKYDILASNSETTIKNLNMKNVD